MLNILPSGLVALVPNAIMASLPFAVVAVNGLVLFAGVRFVFNRMAGPAN